jgi:hypothetical protein
MAGTAVTGRVEHRANSEVRRLRLEHNKVVTDLETLRTILGTDGGTSAGGVVSLVNELAADHAVMVTFLDELDTDSATVSAWQTEVDGDLDDINDLLTFEAGLDGPIGGDWTVTIGAATTLTGAGRVRWRRAGQIYETALDTTITLTDDGDVDNTKWRAWRVEIADTGVVTATADGDTQHATEDSALLGLASTARTANTVELGYFTIQSDSGYAVGDVNVNGESDSGWIYNKMPRQRGAALTANMGASLAAGSTTDRFTHGTVDITQMGVKQTQIAASAGAGIDFSYADTITGADKFGGHLVTVAIDGSTIMTVPADGVTTGAGGVSNMTYASAAAANTALDNAQDRLPSCYPILGRIVVDSAIATFTYGTDDIVGTDGTATFTSETYAAFDRTDQSGTGQGVDQPTIPATVSAAFLAAGVAATNVATLSADTLSTTAVNAASDMTAATVNATAGDGV